ncbi:MAG TPA: alpha/beta hydrolase [Acidimicrobiales bacterium]|nr:alpha/beta hydrolase [Acidimicrobiales bacterium]
MTYDEMGLFRENADEAGLEWKGPPAVARRDVELADGRRVSALVWGEADPELVLLHGGAQNSHTWDTVALALDRPLVAIDLPGHGHSDWRDDHHYTPPMLADDVAVAMGQLAPRVEAVVGMSLGGLTAISLAARYPKLVPRLVVVDVTPGVDRAKAEPIIAFVSGPERFASFDEILERTVQHNPTRTVSSLRRGVLHNARELPDGSWEWRYDRVRSSLADGAIPDMNDLWDELESVGSPLLLVRGGSSGVVGDEDVAELRRRRPAAEVVVVEGAGHSIQGDRPVELAGIIDGFLARPQ